MVKMIYFMIPVINQIINYYLHQSHSIGSAPSSLGSVGSKRFSNRRYRTVNMKSEVDENLFGQPNRLKHAQQLRDAKSSMFIYIRFFSFRKYFSKLLISRQ